ncbi:MAG: biopolymer transporter ExbD [Flavobacteriaceae bacterium]|jgi:biopolymer transport protein ExbD|nr:biopolymer transporter ExbD [Flavobacteriaceae bacterium]
MNFKKRNKVSAEFSMASMTDLVFLLLIFFMLSANTPNALDLLLPKAKGKSTNKQNVAISIKKDLTYYIDAKPIALENIENALVNKLANEENPTIILRVEETVPIEKAVTVMDIANKHKFKIILAVRPQ